MTFQCNTKNEVLRSFNNEMDKSLPFFDSQLFSLPSQRNFPFSFKPKVALAKFIGKMQKKGIMKSGLDAMPLFLLGDLLRPRYNIIAGLN